jgi:hypothetical protein
MHKTYYTCSTTTTNLGDPLRKLGALTVTGPYQSLDAAQEAANAAVRANMAVTVTIMVACEVRRASIPPVEIIEIR